MKKLRMAFPIVARIAAQVPWWNMACPAKPGDAEHPSAIAKRNGMNGNSEDIIFSTVALILRPGARGLSFNISPNSPQYICSGFFLMLWHEARAVREAPAQYGPKSYR